MTYSRRIRIVRHTETTKALTLPPPRETGAPPTTQMELRNLDNLHALGYSLVMARAARSAPQAVPGYPPGPRGPARPIVEIDSRASVRSPLVRVLLPELRLNVEIPHRMMEMHPYILEEDLAQYIGRYVVSQVCDEVERMLMAAFHDMDIPDNEQDMGFTLG